MSFFAELKRRNVFKVAAAYVIVGWLIMQVGEVMAPALNLPDWILSALAFFIILGFPLVLIFAWAFEMTPDGLKLEKNVDRAVSITPRTGRRLDFAIIALLAVALGYFIWEARFASTPDESVSQAVAPQTVAGPDSATDADAPEISPQSIAVLPFENRSQLEADGPFVEGVHDDLLSKLARIGGLKVISRTSVNLYRDKAIPLPQIAQELGVAHVLEGAVQRSGDTVRINVQLIDAQTDEHLWAEIFDRDMTAENLFAIQSEISAKIAEALQATLTDAERDWINAMPTENLDAYDAFVRGRQLMATRDSEYLEQATHAFERAAELDPGFAAAWVGIAESLYHLTNYGTFDWDRVREVGEQAIERALQIDDQLGQAYAVLGLYQEKAFDLDQAETSYRKALQLNPNFAYGYMWYANLLGRFPLRAQEQIDLMRTAVDLDPRASIIGVNLGSAYLEHGRYSLAERYLLKVVELDPGFELAHRALGNLYAITGELARAIAYYRSAAAEDPGNSLPVFSQAWIFVMLGETARARDLLDQLEAMQANYRFTGLISSHIDMVEGNPAGVRETIAWVIPKASADQAPLEWLGELELLYGDPGRAREIFEASNPGWVDPSSWRGLIQEHKYFACYVAWVLQETGNPALGDQLLQQTLTFLTEELPAAIEHAHVYNPGPCYVMAGEFEEFFAVSRTRLAHGHVGFWREYFGLPMYDPIREESRFLALLAEHDRLIAEQRDLVRQLDEGMAL